MPVEPPETRARAGAALGVAVVVAVGAALVAGLLAGGLRPTGLLDPGVVVRWGLPVVTVVAQIAAAVVVGSLVLVAAVLPPARSRAALTVASGAAVVWTLAALVHLVLRYADVAGRSVGGTTFGAELALFVTAVSLGRSLLGIVALAAVVALVTRLVRRPAGAMVAALLAASALAVQSQTGHAAGRVSHELAISSMFLHLIGAAVWIGGLATLVVVGRRLGTDLAAAVARYSAIAAWCFVAVGVSGAVNAATRVGGVDGLASVYGLLVVAKMVLFVALGLAGAAHRRWVVGRLSPAGPDDGAGRLLRRLAAVELALMGAVSGVAVALSAAPPPVPATAGRELTAAEIVTGHPLPAPPSAELWLTSFRWDLLPALGCLAAVVVYLRWVARLRRRGDRWPVGRSLSLVAGTTLLAWTTSGGPAVYGHVLFSAHMVQHMVLVMVVPVFVVLSAPVTLAARALPARHDGSWGPREWVLRVVGSRWARFLAHPVVAAVNFAGSMVAFYFTGLFELALTTYVGHLLMIVHFTLAGYLFVNALIGVDPGPVRPSYPLRLILLFATMVFHAFFGLALVSTESLLVPEWFGLLGRPWGPSALADQRTGGAIAMGISELPMLAIAIAVALAWTRDDERTARRRDRAADRDGDAELVEYNAMLDRLNRERH